MEASSGSRTATEAANLSPFKPDDARQQQNGQNWQDEHAARQEQQRKEVLRRMWRRVSGMSDPIDVTA